MSYLVIQWPWILILLLGLVPLSRLLAHARRQRSRVYQSLGRQATGSSVMRDRIRLICVALLVVALSRPGFDPERQAVTQTGRDVVFAIDVSRSMLAQDAQPSRLEAAKQGVRDAIEQLRNERVGLLIYAGSASILCPLTRDYDFVLFMLDQANPRAVDFGGTTLLSAVEKSVDNIFMEGREGMQDLVILTDGEDHAFDMERIAETLLDAEVDLLIVGIGDPVSGARIPITNEEGNLTYLKYKDREVYSKLEETTLKELVRIVPGSTYFGSATLPFDLGGLYLDFILKKPVSEGADGDTYVIYKEAGLMLVGLGLMLFLLTDGAARKLFPLIIAALLTGFISPQQAEQLEQSFGTAIDLQKRGNHSDAIDAYAGIEEGMNRMGLSPEHLAIVRFNQGLSYLKLAESQGEQAPEGALASARMARLCFLDAKRMNPSLERSGMRLDSTADIIIQFELRVRESEKQQQALQEQLQSLLERLEGLFESQVELLEKVGRRDPDSPINKPDRRRATVPQPAKMIPPPAPEEISEFIQQQNDYLAEGQSIEDELKFLNLMVTPPPVPGEPAVKGFLHEPVQLMSMAVDYQKKAVEQLPDVLAWKLARANQNLAAERMLAILKMLSAESSESDEDGDQELEDFEEGEDGTPSSQMMQGDLASANEMQPLPIPNYSADELLMEEKNNLQFRQEQRAKAQAGKVERDW